MGERGYVLRQDAELSVHWVLRVLEKELDE